MIYDPKFYCVYHKMVYIKFRPTIPLCNVPYNELKVKIKNKKNM